MQENIFYRVKYYETAGMKPKLEKITPNELSVRSFLPKTLICFINSEIIRVI